MNGKKILIVDPIFRGSRLYESWVTATTFLKEGYTVTILSRTEAVTEHYEEFFSGTAHDLLKKIPVRKDLWYGKISLKGTLVTIREIERLIRRDQIDLVFFSGWNEFFPKLPLFLALMPATVFKHTKVFAVDYVGDYLIREENTTFWKKIIKNTVKQVITNLTLIRLKNLSIFLADERVFNEHLSRIPRAFVNRFVYLPDPSPSISREFLPTTGTGKRQEFKMRILLVGTQSKRKGLVDVVRLLEKYDFSQSSVLFHLVGRLTPETEYLRERISRIQSGSFYWDEGFFTEEQVLGFYINSDYLLLPYAKSFSSSSGVFAYAAAAAKPVIVTKHGCLGYRVRKFNLGYTYEAGDIDALFEVMRCLEAQHGPAYRQFSENMRQYGLRTSEESFRKLLLDAYEKGKNP